MMLLCINILNPFLGFPTLCTFQNESYFMSKAHLWVASIWPLNTAYSKETHDQMRKRSAHVGSSARGHLYPVFSIPKDQHHEVNGFTCIKIVGKNVTVDEVLSFYFP